MFMIFLIFYSLFYFLVLFGKVKLLCLCLVVMRLWLGDDDWDCWLFFEEIVERSFVEQKFLYVQLFDSGFFYFVQFREDIFCGGFDYFGDDILDFEYDNQEMFNLYKLMYFVFFVFLQSKVL